MLKQAVIAVVFYLGSMSLNAASSTALPTLKAPTDNDVGAAPSNSAAPSKNDQDSDAHFRQLQAVQIYSQDELITLINKNQHLARVKADDCQLVQDIKARAEKVKSPAYEFLWGDMLAWGVCVPKNAELGIHFMWESARQGLPAALEQLGRYYHQGQFVMANQERAIQLLRESASLGFLKARMEYVQLLAAGYGSPHNYEQAYKWLQNSIFEDKETHQQAQLLLTSLALRMPPDVVARAKATRPGY
ncbi:tetratricopeptide repeat protein [Celerinatantimonas sp. YJH-8]|uniref:tetratricopeptide repeat protein n=1 Tax=Celerinatantimonas sp. YJH-8 TaxID=3228714 RepID=UPI0038CAC19E